MRKHYLLIALGLSVVLGCSQETPNAVEDGPTTIEQLVAEAQAELDILTPSLEQVTKDLAAGFDQHCRDNYKGKPGLNWTIEDGDSKLFVAPAELVAKESDDGTPDDSNTFVSKNGERLVKRQFNTKRTYTLTACEKQYQLGSVVIHSITRTGQSDAPFAGVVKFETVELTRSASQHQAVPLSAPEHYRLPKEGDSADGEIEIEEELVDETEEHGGRWVRIFDYGPFSFASMPASDRENLPDQVRLLVASLFRDCLTAEPDRTTKTQSITFYYRVAEKKWDWRSDWQPDIQGLPNLGDPFEE